MDADSSPAGVLDAPAATPAATPAAADTTQTAPVTWETSPLARIYNPDGSQKDGAAEALKELGYEDISGVLLRNGAGFFDTAKQHKDARATLSQKMEGVVKLPGADATPEQHQEFRKSLGALSKADDYAAAMWPDDLPEGFAKDEGLGKMASEWAAEHPVNTPEAVKALTGKFIAHQAAQIAAANSKAQEEATELATKARAALTTELGGEKAFEMFSLQAKEFLSGQAAKQFGFDFKKDESGKLHAENPLHQAMVNDPAFLRMLHGVVKDHRPASLPGSGGMGAPVGNDSPRMKELIGKMANGTMSSSERSEYNAARGITSR